MASELAAGDVLARSLADWRMYWDWLGAPSAAQRRWRDFERDLRISLAKEGQLPAQWLIAEIRCGKWEKRQRLIKRNMLRHQAKLATWKREGYTFDAEHRLVAPEPRESGSRPRERRTRRRGGAVRTRPGASRDGPGLSESDDEPPPVARRAATRRIA
jgi:hypothetical protein